jgi:long-subunit fatty acid transport protein
VDAATRDRHAIAAESLLPLGSVNRFLPAGAALAIGVSLTARADSPALGIPAPVVGMNTNRTFPGVWESLEAGATLVRCADASAIWYNPAGIVGLSRSTVAASAPSYQFSFFNGSQPVGNFSSQGIPNFAGVVLGDEVIPWRNVRIGFGVANPISFSAGPSFGQTDSAGNRYNYSTSSSLSSFQALFALAYAPFPEHLRIGLSAGASYDQLSVEAQSSTEFAGATYEGSTGFMSIYANTEQFVSALGIQYRPYEWLAVGGVARLPPVELLGNSGISYESIANTTEQQQLHFNSGGSFALHLPAQLEIGATTRFGRFAVEGNLFWLLPRSTYTMLSSSQPIQVATAPNVGGPAQVATSPFHSIETANRSVLNGSIGGNYKFDERWRFHLGAYWSQAPTNDSDSFFQPIDFYGIRAGVALTEESGPSGSLGLGYEYGHSNRPIASPSLPGTAAAPASGELDIHTFSLLLALSYGF